MVERLNGKFAPQQQEDSLEDRKSIRKRNSAWRRFLICVLHRDFEVLVFIFINYEQNKRKN